MTDVLNIYQAMAKVMAELAYIPKGRSSGVSYEFRGIDAVMNHLHGPLADHGLFLAPRVLDDWQVNQIAGTNNRTQTQALFRVEVTVWAADGTCVTLGPGLAQSHDYGDKAVYQAQQNAIKYLLLEAFCIPTSEQDMDAREADDQPAWAPDPTIEDVDLMIADAKSKGVDAKFEEARAYAAQAPGNIPGVLRKLRAAIAEVEQGDAG